MKALLTLDPDVAQLVEREVEGRGLSFEVVVNDGLRKGLGTTRPLSQNVGRFEVQPLNLKFREDIDANRLNALADALELEEHLRKMV